MLLHLESKCLCSISSSVSSGLHLHNNAALASRTGHLRHISTTQQACRKSKPVWKKRAEKAPAAFDFLYGVLPTYSALTARQRSIVKIYMDAKWETFNERPLHRHLREKVMETASARNLNISYVSGDVLDKLSRKDPHEGMMVHASKLTFKTVGREDVEDMAVQKEEKEDKQQFWLSLNSLQDPMNFGSILRACSYYGVDRVFVNWKTSCPLTAHVAYASQGAVDRVPVYGVNNMADFLTQLNAHQAWDIVGTLVSSGDRDWDKSKYSCENTVIDKPSILVVGNEGFGIDEDIAEQCTKMTSVMSSLKRLPPGLDSLNVSVATGVLLDALIGMRPADVVNDLEYDHDQGPSDVVNDLEYDHDQGPSDVLTDLEQDQEQGPDDENIVNRT